MQSQQQTILSAFKTAPGNTLTLSQLLKICPAEYRARISELRRRGEVIVWNRKRIGNYKYYEEVS